MSFRFVAIGDAPYHKDQRDALSRLVLAINGLSPVFTVHLGDVKSGDDSYADKTYLRVREILGGLDHACLYTPGDNDWSDSKSGPEHLDPLDRLSFLRGTLCGPRVPWQEPAGLVRQSEEGGRDAPYVENVRWMVGDVLCASFHAVGSDSKRASGPRERERKQRLKANLRWLESAMKAGADASSLVLLTHANLWTGRTIARASVARGFRKYRQWLVDKVAAFGKPVLLVHGDKHQLIIDQPLWRKQDDRESVVANFTRLQVFGGHQVGAVEVTVGSPASPFSFKPMQVP